MGLGLGLKVKASQSLDEANTLKIVCTSLTGPPKRVVEQVSEGGVTHVNLRNLQARRQLRHREYWSTRTSYEAPLPETKKSLGLLVVVYG
jgi:hypothetical protein